MIELERIGYRIDNVRTCMNMLDISRRKQNLVELRRYIVIYNYIISFTYVIKNKIK